MPDSVLDALSASLKSQNLDVRVEPRPPAIFAAFEWAIPTIVVAYLAKPFFEAFLQEAGKDSYLALKTGLLALFKVLFGSKPEKREPGRSLVFSIQFHDAEGRLVKCVFPEGMTNKEYGKVLDELQTLLAAEFGHEGEDTISKMLEGLASFGGQFFIEYSVQESAWIAVDTQAEIRKRAGDGAKIEDRDHST